MLVIRRSQLKIFEKLLVDTFVANCTSYVSEKWPQAASFHPEPGALREFVADSVARGRAAGFRDRGHLTIWLDWECEFGPRFAETPGWEWLRAILESGLDSATRIHRIDNRLHLLRQRGTP